MLRRYTWEKAKEKLQHYRRRSPEASPLYQIVYHSRDDLQFQWESKFQHQYGCLRDEVLKTFDEYLNCGILAHGAARVYCEGCKHSLLIAFSCKRRGVCPSCGAKRAVKFAEHIYSKVKGRVVMFVPKTAKKPQKLYTNLFRVSPTDTTKKCMLLISRDGLGSDETKLKNKALGASIKLRLEGDGFTVSSFKTQGQSHTAYLTGFAEAPWQKVGTAAVRGVGKFTRTADKQLIGSVLLCDPAAWDDTANKGYKTAVLKAVVTQR